MQTKGQSVRREPYGPNQVIILYLRILGKDREEFTQCVTVSDVNNMGLNEMKLSLILNKNAGIIDDCLITKFENEMYKCLLQSCGAECGK